MKRSISLLMFGLAMCVAATTAQSSENTSNAEIKVHAELDNAILTIGDRATYKVTIEHPSGVKIYNIEVSESLKDFEIKDEKPFQSNTKTSVIEGKNFVITNFQIGEYVLAPAKVLFEGQGGIEQTIESNKLYVTVETVDKSGKAPLDIRGIKGVVSLHSRIIFTLIYIALTISLLAIAFFLWKKYFQKSATATSEEESPLSPEEEAYRALDQLFDSDLLRRSQYKLYCLSLTEILKHYMERRYHFSALESTTYELMIELKKQGIGKDAFDQIERVMSFCDLVKFAKSIPQPSEFIEVNRTARAIIDLTKPSESLAATAQPSKSND